jgi:hypothetical protein
MSAANDLTQKILGFLYMSGAYAWRANSVGVFDKRKGIYRTSPKKGVSDILACWQGRMIVVEVKIGKDRLSDEQVGFIKNIEHVGGLAFVAKDYDSFVEWWTLIATSS